MRPLYQKLTAVEFNRAAKYLKANHTRLSEKNIDLARTVLVDGVSAPTLARKNQCTTQLINRHAAAVYQAFIESLDLPDNWVSLRIELPETEAQKVKDLETQLKAALKDRKNLST